MYIAIRRVQNGYITIDEYGNEKIHLTLSDVLAYLRLYFGDYPLISSDDTGDDEIMEESTKRDLEGLRDEMEH